ncbi:hypothetical protein EC957_012045 [Mortierella hygrophila]|uniref:Uncharacterized protein n=1 Tax=Mortierella hygrophila TaxID=979708 RepID=A0A9P6FI52_9FUNG|nr:hypothetical protein EC957_012045 [Mortierella hygrophila]
MTVQEKVFDILELATLIADELTQHDLALCCLVNFHWYSTFTPHLWHSITVQSHDPPKFLSPSGRAGLVRNGHHIRVLRTSCGLEILDPFVKYGFTCTNLVCLDTEPFRTTSIGVRSATLIATGRRGSVGAGQVQVPYDFHPAPPSPVTSPSTAVLFKRPPPNTTVDVNAPTLLYEEAETILVTILKRNPRLEFLVIHPDWLENEVVVKVIAEDLLDLKEFYSSVIFGASKKHGTSYSLYKDGSGWEQGGRGMPEIKGYIQSASTMPDHLSEAYPRLKELLQGAESSLCQEAQEKLRFADRDFNGLNITGRSPEVAQIMMEIPTLKSIVISVHGRTSFVDRTTIPAFLKHAPTLERLCFFGCGGEGEIIRSILCSCSELKTLKTMADYGRHRPLVDEIELDALTVFETPWVSNQLEVFECKIVKIPRPDLIIQPVFHPATIAPLHPGAQAPPHIATFDQDSIAQQESRSLQRRILRQLGQLTHLRILRLGSSGRDWDNPHHMRLEIEMEGTRTTMVVDEYVQTTCLELSLASGLDELAELKDLETLDVTQLAHRIGMAEVQWMVENWPKLKSIPGLEYTNHSREAALQGGDVGENHPGAVESVPEHVRWIREQLWRPQERFPSTFV